MKNIQYGAYLLLSCFVYASNVHALMGAGESALTREEQLSKDLETQKQINELSTKILNAKTEDCERCLTQLKIKDQRIVELESKDDPRVIILKNKLAKKSGECNNLLALNQELSALLTSSKWYFIKYYASL